MVFVVTQEKNGFVIVGGVRLCDINVKNAPNTPAHL
jgi:hypothetical protein